MLFLLDGIHLFQRMSFVTAFVREHFLELIMQCRQSVENERFFSLFELFRFALLNIFVQLNFCLNFLKKKKKKFQGKLEIS